MNLTKRIFGRRQNEEAEIMREAERVRFHNQMEIQMCRAKCDSLKDMGHLSAEDKRKRFDEIMKESNARMIR
jgi:hypothetical protein